MSYLIFDKANRKYEINGISYTKNEIEKITEKSIEDIFPSNWSFISSEKEKYFLNERQTTKTKNGNISIGTISKPLAFNGSQKEFIESILSHEIVDKKDKEEKRKKDKSIKPAIFFFSLIGKTISETEKELLLIAEEDFDGKPLKIVSNNFLWETSESFRDKNYSYTKIKNGDSKSAFKTYFNGLKSEKPYLLKVIASTSNAHDVIPKISFEDKSNTLSTPIVADGKNQEISINFILPTNSTQVIFEFASEIENNGYSYKVRKIQLFGEKEVASFVETTQVLDLISKSNILVSDILTEDLVISPKFSYVIESVLGVEQNDFNKNTERLTSINIFNKIFNVR